MSQEDLKIISEPITFFHSGKTAPNRLLKSAMTERLCVWSDDDNDADLRGQPTKQYLELYKQWGQGGIGTIVMGNVPCDRRYPESKGNAIIDKTQSWDHVKAFKPVIAAAKAGGSIVLVQVTHAGRQTYNGIAPEPVSSSDVQSAPLGGMTFNKPRPMTIDEIEDLIDRFAFAAKVLYDAGADGIQLHSAHGYLLSQFLSPRVNKRTDRYGGSYKNRSRLLFEIIAAIRSRVPDKKFILSIKINSADFADGGFSPEDSKETVLRLEKAGLDLIELSGGTYESRAFFHKSESTVKREAYFVEFAERIRPHLTTAKLAVTGGFRSSTGMAQAIREKSCDITGLGRPLTAEPDLAKLLVEGKKPKAKENNVPVPLQTLTSVLQLEDISNGRPARDLESKEGAEAAAKVAAAGPAPGYPSKL
ncbi:FMN-linked oxidoreductase [Meredithblackwellia eburnea MCA 4105]